MLNGWCLCGEGRFTVEDSFSYAFYCHCSRCRLRTGSGPGKVSVDDRIARAFGYQDGQTREHAVGR